MGQQRAATWEGRGVYHGFGDVRFTMEGAWQGKDQAAMKSVSTFPGGMFTRIVVVDKDRGWLVMNDQVNELDKAALAEEKERLYGNWVATLLPLADRGFRLKHLGESKVADHAVTGVDIVSDGHRPVRLFFDKETGLIAKKETRGKPTPDKESIEEVIYSDYQLIEGVKHATKLKFMVDGKLTTETEITVVHPTKSLDDKHFAKPAAAK